jgi:hypothetical protein
MEMRKAETITQQSLFEVPWEKGRDYKVKWKKFESIYEEVCGIEGYHKKFGGFSDKIRFVTTAGMMTLQEAESFARFVSEDLYEYAGWHEIVNVER